MKTGTKILIIVLAVLIPGGIALAYYFLIYKKQQNDKVAKDENDLIRNTDAESLNPNVADAVRRDIATVNTVAEQVAQINTEREQLMAMQVSAGRG